MAIPTPVRLPATPPFSAVRNGKKRSPVKPWQSHRMVPQCAWRADWPSHASIGLAGRRYMDYQGNWANAYDINGEPCLNWKGDYCGASLVRLARAARCCACTCTCTCTCTRSASRKASVLSRAYGVRAGNRNRCTDDTAARISQHSERFIRITPVQSLLSTAPADAAQLSWCVGSSAQGCTRAQATCFPCCATRALTW
jgi:hypothetical protein